MTNGDQYLTGGGAVPVRLAENNPAAVPVFESTNNAAAIAVTVRTFEQNPGALPVQLATAATAGAVPVRVITGGGSLSPGESHLPDTEDWSARVASNGGSVSESTLSAVDDFVSAVAALRTKFIRLNLHAGSQLAAARVPLYLGNGTVTYGNTTDVNSDFLSTDYVERGHNGGLNSDNDKYSKSGFTPPLKSMTTGVNLSTVGSTNLAVGSWNSDTMNTPISGYSGQFNSHAPYVYSDSLTSIYGYYNGFGAADFISRTGSGIGLVSISRTASNALALYKNGTSLGTSSSASVAAIPNSNTVLWGLRNKAWLSGYFFSTGLTAGEQTTLYNAWLAFNQALGRDNVGVHKYIFVGDSLTEGWAGATPYPTALQTYWTGGKSWNTGIATQVLGAPATTNNGTGQYDVIKNHKPDATFYTKCLLFVWFCTNDLAGGTSAADCYTSLLSYWAAARADGFKVIAFTIPPRADAAFSAADETERQALNSSILGDATKYDAVVDAATLFPNPNDLTYFNADKVHLNSTGNATLAAYINSNINPYSI